MFIFTVFTANPLAHKNSQTVGGGGGGGGGVMAFAAPLEGSSNATHASLPYSNFVPS